MDPSALRQFALAARALPGPERAQLARNAIIHVLARQVSPHGEYPEDEEELAARYRLRGTNGGMALNGSQEAAAMPERLGAGFGQQSAHGEFAPPGLSFQPGAQNPRFMPDQSAQGRNAISQLVRPAGETGRIPANRELRQPVKASNEKHRDYSLTKRQEAVLRMAPRTVAQYQQARLRYWTLRWEENKEGFARRAIGIVRNKDFWPRQANSRLNDYWRKKYGRDITELDVQKIGWDLVKAHAEAVRRDFRDPDGVPGLLSRQDIRDFHHKVFRKWGLPPETFGGDSLGALLIHPVYNWCPECDTTEGR